MNEEELLETLRQFEEKRVEQLNENARNLFYAIMKIADERDFLKIKYNKALELLVDFNLPCEKDEFDQIYSFDKGLLFYKDSGTIILPWNNQDIALDVLYDLIKADMVEKIEGD